MAQMKRSAREAATTSAQLEKIDAGMSGADQKWVVEARDTGKSDR
jgi:hypothetical protein